MRRQQIIPVVNLVQAAIRETSEETDLDVELTGIVGLYSRLGSFSPGHMVLFAARSVGGRLRRQEGETIAVDWFSPDDLPSPLGPGHRRRILDALAGKRGLAVSQHIRIPGMPGKWTRKDYIAVRDASGLQRQEFFKQLFGNLIFLRRANDSGVIVHGDGLSLQGHVGG